MMKLLPSRRRRRILPRNLSILPMFGILAVVAVGNLWSDGRPDGQQPRILNGGGAWGGGGSVSTKTARTTQPGSRPGSILLDRVTRVRDGDTIVVGLVPVRIANLDCAEAGSAAGDRATAQISRIVAGVQLRCTLEGRRSYDREVGVCALPDGRDIGEMLIAGGYCQRWRG
ncbi:thermonuclease family protein [Seohaeicola zhoushanensis]|nr:hypothetical protein [Seohaeicola zhoushanensis]